VLPPLIIHWKVDGFAPLEALTPAAETTIINPALASIAMASLSLRGFPFFIEKELKSLLNSTLGAPSIPDGDRA
jgi:hypothetical protein